MKVCTILGTRPEIIRLSLITEKLDAHCDHVLVHTSQNHDPRLSTIFFEELGVREPDHVLGIQTTSGFGAQIGQILAGCQRILEEERPDRVLILGDTNSGLSAIVAKRMGIPVYHMEAGNRCFDDRVPEEVNRRIIDHSSDVLMPYTDRSRQNLLAEGFRSQDILVTGNPILEVIEHFADRIDGSDVLARLDVAEDGYLLVTLHRAENVDVGERLRAVLSTLEILTEELGVPAVVSTHPRTRERMKEAGIQDNLARIRFLEPFGFPDFVKLEQKALCVLTDSGTVQEECCIFQRPSVILRDATERMEILEGGGGMLSGTDPATIRSCVRMALQRREPWTVPAEYLQTNVSNTVVKILLSR